MDINFIFKMDISFILERNKKFIESIVSKYQLKYSFGDLVFMNTVYVNFEQEAEKWGFRVFGIIIEKGMKEVLDEFGNPMMITVSLPQKKVNVFNFLKKSIDKVKNQDEVFKIREDFITFTYYLQQIKNIEELEKNEAIALNARAYSKFRRLRIIK